LAQRGTAGLARTGGFGLATSGDIFLAFSTGNHVSPRSDGPYSLQAFSHFSIDPLVLATVEAVEEAILNSMLAAETMTGQAGRTAYALPHDRLLAALFDDGSGKYRSNSDTDERGDRGAEV
jgi:D-aminopeptidase